MTFAAVLVAAYLLGAIPTSYIVVYGFTGRDVRSMGSGNPGTMNVLDTVGVLPALLVGGGDILKGMAAVGIAYAAGLGDLEAVAAAAVAVIGHDYSVFLRLHGGNGTAAAVGGFAALLPLETAIAVAAATVALVLLRSRRIGGLIGLTLVPTLAFWFDAPDTKLLGVFVLLAVMAFRILRFEGLSPARVRSDR